MALLILSAVHIYLITTHVHGIFWQYKEEKYKKRERRSGTRIPVSDEKYV